MKKSSLCRVLALAVVILAASSVCLAGEHRPWLGEHVGLNT